MISAVLFTPLIYTDTSACLLLGRLDKQCIFDACILAFTLVIKTMKKYCFPKENTIADLN